MTLDEMIQKSAVIGAAGKMGRGISLLLLQEMALRELNETGSLGTGTYSLCLVDTQQEALLGLKHYLEAQLLRYAEKNINRLRKTYANHPKLIDNADMIQSFVKGALDIVHLHKHLDSCQDSLLIFEAIAEEQSIKVPVYQKLGQLCSKDTLFFSNTSSLPLHVLNKESGLVDRIVGLHFYNPPPVQKLLEVIFIKNTPERLKTLSLELVKTLKKIPILSKDVAGFIGNGHFIREIAFACKKVEELCSFMDLSQAIYTVNQVTQELLLRPMGIFQLIDYVGLDVCEKIFRIMRTYIPEETFDAPLLQKALKDSISGGQHVDGSQKEGLFRYEKGRPTSIYDWDSKSYQTIPSSSWIGKAPEGLLPWKALAKDPQSQDKIKHYFQNLSKSEENGALLAKEFLAQTQRIAQALVDHQVAETLDDVSTILKTGFGHLYNANVTLLEESKV